MLLRKLLLIFAVGIVASPMNGAVVVVDGGPPSTVVPLAPGQVATFHIQGIGSGLKGSIYATGLPLPTVLAGISVNLVQLFQGPLSVPVPIFSIQLVSPCNNDSVDTTPGCGSSYVAVTVHLPTSGLRVETKGVLSGPPGTYLQFSENGTVVASVTVHLFTDQIRVCDNSKYNSEILYSKLNLEICGPGNLYPYYVSRASLRTFKSGEEYVLYVFGLGGGVSELAGQATVPGDRLGIKPQVAFDARVNAGPSNPPDVRRGLRDPVSWGPVVGYPGLYQVHVILPDLPAGSPSCGGGMSNMTISVIGPFSFDGDQICMENSVPDVIAPSVITGVVNSSTGQKCDLTANPACTLVASQLDTLELYGLRFNANGGNLLQMYAGNASSPISWLYSGDGYYFWDGHGNATRINVQIGCGVSAGDLRVSVWPDADHVSSNSAPVKVNASGKCP